MRDTIGLMGNRSAARFGCTVLKKQVSST